MRILKEAQSRVKGTEWENVLFDPPQSIEDAKMLKELRLKMADDERRQEEAAAKDLEAARERSEAYRNKILEMHPRAQPYYKSFDTDEPA